jgi:molybdopterin-guanine dinucleotide biosynthesis protein A
MDLAARLLDALERQDAEIAMPSVPETDGRLWPQPVFCLMKAELLSSLSDFTQGGGRKIDAWTARHRCVSVPFNEPADDPQAFFNANTLAELRQLERR